MSPFLSPPMNDQEFRRATRASLVLCLCCAVVAACGGGADDALVADASLGPAPVMNSTPVVPVSVPVAIAPAVEATAPAPASSSAGVDASCGLNGAAGIEAEVLQRVNALRAAGAVCGTNIYSAAAPLIWNKVLQQAASDHSSGMAKNNYFSHDSPDGKTMAQRLLEAGYNYSAAGENIAANDSSVESVVTRWRNSPGHCQNMLNPVYRDIGVACVHSDTGAYSSYWTMELGRTWN